MPPPFASDFDPDLSNNQAFAEHNITDVADLSLLKAAIGEVQQEGQPGGTLDLLADQVTAGRFLTYTLTISNAGPPAAENVVVQDRLPYFGGRQAITPSQGICLWGTPGGPSDTMICALGTLLAHQAATVEIRLEIPAWVDGGTLLRNEALVYSDVFDPDNTTNFAANQVLVSSWADISVSKTSQSKTTLIGDALTYTIVVRNHGPGDAIGVIIDDPLPAQIRSIVWNCIPSDGAYCYISGIGSIHSWAYLYSGASLTYTLYGFVSSITPFTNTVTVTAPLDTPDPYLSNNQASVVNRAENWFIPIILSWYAP